MASYDVAVIGLGAMGSAVTCELSRRHRRVIGFDAFTPPHANGSSHGETRIIREAYFEHPLYVPLVQRAYELWHELERRSGRHLLVRTGGLMIGPPAGALVAGACASARTHNLEHEILTAADLRRHYPAWRLPDSVVAVREPRAGALFPERCIESCLTLAAAQGATLALGEAVLRWEATSGSTRVTTAAGGYDARSLVLCCGAWMPAMAQVPAPLAVERNVIHWFEPPSGSARFGPDAFPVFLHEDDAGGVMYGCPELDSGPGVKVARHHRGETTSPERIDRQVSAREVADVDDWVGRHLPDLAHGWRRASVCMYTNTPDRHFLIDRHPEHPDVWIVSPCSGHGFKFASVVGELVADLVIDGRSRSFDLTPFRWNR